MPRTNRPCRVLHVVTVLGSGGVERWLVDLFEAGRNKNLTMDFAVTQPFDGLFDRKAKDLGIRVLDCNANNPFGLIHNVRRLIRDHGPYDAVHAHVHASSAFVLMAAYLGGVPARIAHSHNVMAARSLGRRSYMRLARALIQHFATAALAPSPEAMEDLLGRDWNRDPRWQIMRCGIDLEPFRSPLADGTYRSVLGIPEDAFVLGWIGRLASEKNPEFLVDVLSQVLRTFSNAYLLVIGEGPLRQQVVSKAEAAGLRDRVIILGVRSDVPTLLRKIIDVFVFPSPPPPRGVESLGIAVIEAQAAGVPIVMSEGVPEAAVVLPELITRVESTAGPSAWAEAVAKGKGRQPLDAANRALTLMEESDCNCLQNISVLGELYRHPNGGFYLPVQCVADTKSR
jgi:glycosyltransferase involved in cell wall biosynthesis